MCFHLVCLMALGRRQLPSRDRRPALWDNLYPRCHSVRRQVFWNQWLPKPRERLAHAGLSRSATPGALAISPVARN